MKSLSIRWQLVAWYGIALSIVLLAFGASVFLLMEAQISKLTDAALTEELADLAGDVGRCRGVADLAEELLPRYASHDGYEFQVSTPGGETLFRSEGLGDGGLPIGTKQSGYSKTTFQSLVLERIGHGRLASRFVPGPGGPVLVQVAVSLASNDHAMRELLMILLLTGPLALAGALAGGYALARKALAPVDRMVAIAAEITASRLDRRLHAPNPDDELGRLAGTFNAMIGRLERSFDEVRRFTADAAHELRTPLAVMRTEAEVALRSPRSPERDGQVLGSLLEEIDRLSRLVRQLLFLCREDSGLASGPRESVRLDGLAREVADHIQVATHEKGIYLDVELSSCTVAGDADRLRQLLFNLLDNAIKFTPPRGRVELRCGLIDGLARVVVADSGTGIPAEHLSRVFDRFYQVDSARSGEGGGTGLGLAICRSIAEAHDGKVVIESDEGRGTRVILTLPCRRIASSSPSRRGLV